jgi:hypothetical protein
MIKYINTWTLKKWQSNLLYTLLGLVYRKKIQKGDKIKCFGIGYPHWKGEIFECTLVFNDSTIGIKNAIRVSEQDFRVVKINPNVLRVCVGRIINDKFK